MAWRAGFRTTVWSSVDQSLLQFGSVWDGVWLRVLAPLAQGLMG